MRAIPTKEGLSLIFKDRLEWATWHEAAGDLIFICECPGCAYYSAAGLLVYAFWPEGS